MAIVILTAGLMILGAVQLANAVLVSRHIRAIEKRLANTQRLLLRHQSEFDAIATLADEEVGTQTSR